MQVCISWSLSIECIDLGVSLMGEILKNVYLGLENNFLFSFSLIHTMILFLFNSKQIAELTHLPTFNQLLLYQRRVIHLTGADLWISDFSPHPAAPVAPSMCQQESDSPYCFFQDCSLKMPEWDTDT